MADFLEISIKIPNNPEKKDIWIQSGTSSLTFEPDLQTVENDQTLAMFRPDSAKAKLSLLLDRLTLTMQPKSELPSAAVNGVSFIGIDGSAGISTLTLNDTTLSVTGANGYPYSDCQNRQINTTTYAQSQIFQRSNYNPSIVMDIIKETT